MLTNTRRERPPTTDATGFAGEIESRGVAIALDLARLVGISATHAGLVLNRVMAGDVAVLRRLGIGIAPDASVDDALRELGRVSEGQAAAFDQTVAGEDAWSKASRG